ncbi:MAG: ABC transporter substrate-binding protein [Negativicutes bacterium]|nr:ABC transporter substrate-binding protein [Negativicutes bacterium]
MIDNNPIEMITTANQKMVELKDYHMTTEFKFLGTVKGETFSLAVHMESDIQNKPFLQKNILTMKMGTATKEHEQTLVQYLEEAGDQIFIYSKANNQWSKQAVPSNNLPRNQYSAFTKIIRSATPIRETNDVIVYNVVANGSGLQEIFEQIIASSGQNLKLPPDFFKNIGDFTYTLSISKNTALMTEMHSDQSAFIMKVVQSFVESLTIPDENKAAIGDLFGNVKADTTITISKINSAEKILVPGEAKTATANPLVPVKPAVTNSQPTSIPPKTAENPTIKVGCNLELTGSIAPFGQDALRGARLAVKEVNAAGGLLGRQVEFIEQDNASDPSQSAKAMVSLISQSKVVAVIGTVGSRNAMAAAPLAEKFRIPLVSPSATNPRVTMTGGLVNSFVFRCAFIDPFQGKVMSEFATGSLGAKRAAILTDNTSDYSKAISQVFQAIFADNGGIIVAQETYRQKDQDFTSQLARIQELNPDVIFIPGYYQEAGLIIKQAREMGITVPLLGADGWDSPRLLQIAGNDALNNTFFSNHFSPQDNTPAVKKFVADYKKEYWVEPNALSALGYDSAELLFAAIKKANSTDPEKIQGALESVELEGVTGKISLDAFHNPEKPAVVIQMANGKQTFFQKINP